MIIYWEKFHLERIPPAPLGAPKVEVTFDIDANGIWNVGAQDGSTAESRNVMNKTNGHLDDRWMHCDVMKNNT